ncbi:MAG: esterase-like activity of phytase family protein [Pseudomonadota bacterium]
MRRACVIAGLATLFFAHPTLAEPLTISATPISSFNTDDPTDIRFGPLTYLSGLTLSSRHAAFGGLSGLSVTDGGKAVLMVSDTGYWVRASTVMTDGRLTGLTDAEIVAMQDSGGVEVVGKEAADAEALAILSEGPFAGQALVAFEREDRIARYDLASNLSAPAVPLETPDGFSDLVTNQGIEGLVALSDASPKHPGALLAFAEEMAEEGTPIAAWVIGGPMPGRFAVSQIGGFAITDAVQLPSGDILLLERRFRPPATLHIALRQLAVADITPEDTVDGKRIAEFDLRYQIDNLEGMALHTDSEGRAILTLISDDNYNPLQRTLMLQFEVDPEAL